VVLELAQLAKISTVSLTGTVTATTVTAAKRPRSALIKYDFS